MDGQYQCQLAQWHEADEYRRIIDAIEAIPEDHRSYQITDQLAWAYYEGITAAIEAIPEDQRGYQLTSQLARAYNNLAQQAGEDEMFERAAELLLSVGEEGEADPVWHFRLGYAYYYLDREEEAAAQFERCLELNPGDKDAQTLLEACREEIERKKDGQDCDPKLHTEKMVYKPRCGVLKRLGNEALVVNPLRGDFFEDESEEKMFAIPHGELKLLLEGWAALAGCIATDRITVDGCPVGYCYREKPEGEGPDSGWLFAAGDETDDYMNDPSHLGFYSLNLIANYDPDILPLLDSPIGSAYYRDVDNDFVPDFTDRLPTWLEPYAYDIDIEEGCFNFGLVSSSFHTLFEIWYYGELVDDGLVDVEGEPLPYIDGTNVAPALITARDAATGEEILLFDGAAHGYRAMFCDKYTDAQRQDRPLRRYRHPASKIHVYGSYGEDHEEYMDDLEVGEDGNVLLADGSSVPFQQVKRDSIIWFSVSFEEEDGSMVEFMQEEI